MATSTLSGNGARPRPRPTARWSPRWAPSRERGRRATRVIVAPPRCHLPEGFRIWGWAAQLYATRSRESWGIGDLGDLRRLGRWSRTLGANLILLNPLAAATVTVAQEASPYTPSSRRFRNPLYLRLEDVPGFAHA